MKVKKVKMKKPKVLLIGWDAADWQTIWPCIKKGYMPALKSIMDRGVYGNMATLNPSFSPMLWTSVATGKTPDKHGVLGFLEVMPSLKGIRETTSASRKTRALWNIFHNQGLKSNLVGWWPSFPAEPINGVVVSDHFQKNNKNREKVKPTNDGVIHPKSFEKKLEDLKFFSDEFTTSHLLPFIPNANKIDFKNKQHFKKFSTFLNMLGENCTVHNVFTNLIRTTEWDFTAVYYDLIDHIGHTFMEFYPPKMKHINDLDYEIFNQMVDHAYRFQDMMLARTLELVDDDTTIIIMSDHGFESGTNRRVEKVNYFVEAALEHRQFGMFVAAGPNIKSNEKVFGLGLVDVAPTILNIFDLPIGEDMDGRVAKDIFINPKPENTIPSWDLVKGDFGELDKNMRFDQISSQEAINQMVELGYIEKPSGNLAIDIKQTYCDKLFNLAKVYVGKGDFIKAKEILLDLVKEKPPIDTTPYYLELVFLSINDKDVETSEKYLKILKTAKSRFTFNTFFIEVSILKLKGEYEKAIGILNAQVQKFPSDYVYFQMGQCYRHIDKFYEAGKAFENAIEINGNKAKYWVCLGEVHFQLEEYEDTVDEALTAIELVRNFADAHYLLGMALEKLGDLENSKTAFLTAKHLLKKDSKKIDHAVENIETQISVGSKQNLQNSPIKDAIIAVSGLPRSGTSLMMQMLNEAGCKVLIDAEREADESNPKGYFEYKPVMNLINDNSWLHKAKSKAVKIVAPLLKFLDQEYRYKVIFMQRDLDEIMVSQSKMLKRDHETLSLSLKEGLESILSEVKRWVNSSPGVQILVVDYNALIDNPDSQIPKIVEFLDLDLDTAKMSNAIDASLYRNRLKKKQPN